MIPGYKRFLSILLISLLATTSFALPRGKKAKKEICADNITQPIGFIAGQSVTYAAVEIGDFDFSAVVRDPKTGISRVMAGTLKSQGQIIPVDFSGIKFEFMPDADPIQLLLRGLNIFNNMPPAYYAIVTRNLATGDYGIQVHSLDSLALINQKIDKELDLVWATYLAEGTVTASEIEGFKDQEHLLDARRKATFALHDPITGKTLSVLRLYDGTDFPGFYFADVGTHFEYDVKTDKRLMVEHRYPEINFRETTDYIFEAGRLAKDATASNALETQFYSMAEYLMYKYGYNGYAPRGFTDGRIYIEITGRNLKKFLRSHDENGYGFTLFREVPVKPGESPKYLLYSTVTDFISNFYMQVTIQPVSQ